MKFKLPYKIHEYMKPMERFFNMTPEEFDRHITLSLYGRGRRKTNFFSYYLLEQSLEKLKKG